LDRHLISDGGHGIASVQRDGIPLFAVRCSDPHLRRAARHRDAGCERNREILVVRQASYIHGPRVQRLPVHADAYDQCSLVLARIRCPPERYLHQPAAHTDLLCNDGIPSDLTHRRTGRQHIGEAVPIPQLVAADPIEQHHRDHIDRQRYPALFSQRLQIHAYSVISFKYRANAFFHSGSS